MLVLAVPETFMNDSGLAVGPLVRRYAEDDLARTVVLHDELDLDPGVVRVKQGGGLAGHNGLRSIAQHLHDRAFVRVRIGIGRPTGRASGVDYVLSRPTRSERELLCTALEEAADAVELLLSEGVVAAMNRFNRQ
jgi:PTH1 family peptidyl-tRNA hydrolase